MKKVLISWEDILELRANIFRKHFQNCENPDNPTNAAYGVAIFESELCKWFNAQPDAAIYKSWQTKVSVKDIEKFLQSDNLVLDGTRCESCGQLGRIKGWPLSKMETTGGE